MKQNSDAKGVAKATETKTRVKKAFLALYSKKQIEKISIREITELANINRGTFYAHYLDIYDLREQVEDETIQLLENRAKPIIDSLLQGRPLQEALPSKQFFVEESDYLSLALGENANPVFVNRLQKRIQKYVLNVLHFDPEHLSAETEYTLKYLTAGQFGIISYWFRSGMDLPVDDMGRLLASINSQGPLRHLLSQSSHEFFPPQYQAQNDSQKDL